MAVAMVRSPVKPFRATYRFAGPNQSHRPSRPEMALDFLPMVKKEMAEGPVPPPTAPFFVGNDKSFGRWRGKSLASVPPE